MEFRFDPKERRLHIRTLVPAGQGAPVFVADDLFQFGVDEEYFLSDAKTMQTPGDTPDALFETANKTANIYSTGHVGREFLQAQIEVATEPHCSAEQARHELLRLRGSAAAAAAEHGLAILACGTHPLAAWRDAVQSPKGRYSQVMDLLQMIGQRNMLCGMHVHVEFPDPMRRVDVMTRMLPYVPLFIALSTSSPFWQGRVTGLKGYRLAAYDELPRTGLPELFRSYAEYDAYVDAMVTSGAMPDASHLWWTVRISQKYPTLELRAPDCCTRIDDTIAIAALYRALVRHLFNHPDHNAGIDVSTARSRSRTNGALNAMARKAVSSPGAAPCRLPRCSTGWWNSWLPMAIPWAAGASSNAAVRSWPKAPRLMPNCGFLPKMNTMVPRLPSTRWRSGLRMPL